MWPLTAMEKALLHELGETRKKAMDLGFYPVACEVNVPGAGYYMGMKCSMGRTAVLCRPKDYNPRAKLKIQPLVRVEP